MFSALEKDDFSSRRARAILFGQMQQKARRTPHAKQIKLREPAWDIRRKRQSEKNIAS
jgi:hypothetical protein